MVVIISLGGFMADQMLIIWKMLNINDRAIIIITIIIIMIMNIYIYIYIYIYILVFIYI